MVDILYEDVVNFGEGTFVAGSSVNRDFNVVDEFGAPVSLAGAECSCRYALYGFPKEVKLVKIGSIIDEPGGTFRISLTPDDTKDWHGKYIFQPRIKTFNGEEKICGQGLESVIVEIPSS